MMTEFERNVVEALGGIKATLKALEKAIYGNGQPGLIDRVNLMDKELSVIKDNQNPTNQELAHQIKEIQDKLDNEDKSKNKRLEWIAIVAGLVGSLFAIFFKNN